MLGDQQLGLPLEQPDHHFEARHLGGGGRIKQLRQLGLDIDFVVGPSRLEILVVSGERLLECGPGDVGRLELSSHQWRVKEYGDQLAGRPASPTSNRSLAMTT